MAVDVFRLFVAHSSIDLAPIRAKIMGVFHALAQNESVMMEWVTRFFRGLAQDPDICIQDFAEDVITGFLQNPTASENDRRRFVDGLVGHGSDNTVVVNVYYRFLAHAGSDENLRERFLGDLATLARFDDLGARMVPVNTLYQLFRDQDLDESLRARYLEFVRTLAHDEHHGTRAVASNILSTLLRGQSLGEPLLTQLLDFVRMLAHSDNPDARAVASDVLSILSRDQGLGESLRAQLLEIGRTSATG